MPVRPADGADAREVTAADEIEQHVVALHQAPRSARFDPAVEQPVVAVAFAQAHAGERNTVTQVDANVRARVLDLAQAAALGDPSEPGQVVAQALAASATHGIRSASCRCCVGLVLLRLLCFG